MARLSNNIALIKPSLNSLPFLALFSVEGAVEQQTVERIPHARLLLLRHPSYQLRQQLPLREAHRVRQSAGVGRPYHLASGGEVCIGISLRWRRRWSWSRERVRGAGGAESGLAERGVAAAGADRWRAGRVWGWKAALAAAAWFKADSCMREYFLYIWWSSYFVKACNRCLIYWGIKIQRCNSGDCCADRLLSFCFNAICRLTWR